jgi:hypothetical protein
MTADKAAGFATPTYGDSFTAIVYCPVGKGGILSPGCRHFGVGG